MKAPLLPALERTPVWPASWRRRGFSLVEITLAVAIVGFAFVAMLGLIPTGLSNVRAAMNTQTAAEIFRRVAADLQEADFDALLESKAEQGGRGSQFYRLPLRYFDEQGQEVRVSDSEKLTSDEAARIMYTVRVRGSMPGNPDPDSHSANYFTSIPGVRAPRFNPRDSTFLTIQIALTQGRPIDTFIHTEEFLIDPKRTAEESVPLKTYSTVITRNGYLTSR